MAQGPVTEERPRPPGGVLYRVAVVCAELLIIAALLWVLGKVLAALAVVVVPLAVAVLLAALFTPAVGWLTRRGLPHALAATAVLLGGLIAVGGLVWFVVQAFVAGLPDLAARLDESLNQLRGWLAGGPLGLEPGQLDQLVAEGRDWVSRNRQQLVSGAWGAFSTVGAVLAGLAMTVFILIFFMYDGPRMWRGMTSPFPESVRDTVRHAGSRAFHDLTAFTRALILIALIDAVGIGIGLWITGVPLVIPLAALVFLGAFVPIVGAFVSGLVAVLVALVAQGPVIALVVAGIVVAVQQLEGNVLEPFITSSAVKLHPVAVLLAVAVGVTQAGITGALLAVPLLVTLRAVALAVRERRAAPEQDRTRTA